MRSASASPEVSCCDFALFSPIEEANVIEPLPRDDINRLAQMRHEWASSSSGSDYNTLFNISLKRNRRPSLVFPMPSTVATVPATAPQDSVDSTDEEPWPETCYISRPRRTQLPELDDWNWALPSAMSASSTQSGVETSRSETADELDLPQSGRESDSEGYCDVDGKLVPNSTLAKWLADAVDRSVQGLPPQPADEVLLQWASCVPVQLRL